MPGFWALLRLRIRRDRWQVPAWAVGTALLAYLSYVGVTQSYGTEDDRAGLLATAIANPVIMLFRGLPSGADEGAFMLFLIFPFLAMLAAFMSSFLAVRHTRGEEETGRAELVAATTAGRATPLFATIVHGLLANALLAALTALAYQSVGLPARGSWVSGLGAAAVGVVFLGVALVGAQLFRSARSANSLGVWMLLAAYLVSGIGNALGAPTADLQRIESSWLVWLSPFGWGEQSRPFADDNGWPLLLAVGVGLALAASALALQSVRDFGEGFLAERSGRATARASLDTSTALVWRLTWPATAAWAIGGLVTGLLATALSSALKDAASQTPSITAIVDALTANGSLEQGAIVVFFTMLGILAACCAVQIVCRARQEEARGAAELVLSTPVDRVRWLSDYLLVAFVGIILVIAMAIVGAALGLAAQSNADWTLMGDAVVTGAGQVAAASVFLVVTALVFVIAPRLTIPLGWALVALATVLGLFGALFGFPDWLVHLAPIADAPTVGSDGVDLNGLWWLVIVSVLGGVGSLALMRRRELAADG